MLQQGRLFVHYDFKPWGGAVAGTTVPIPDVRVTRLSINAGATFDTATIIFPRLAFGDLVSYFLPLKIVYLEPVSGTQFVVFKGFIQKDNQIIDPSQSTVTVELVDYRWYISRTTKIRGRFYRNTLAASGAPNQLGSGLTIGAGKFTFEKFRADIQDNAGFLHNEDTVFNKNGNPDCYLDNNTSNLLAVFHADDIAYEETQGLPDTFFEKKLVGGFYWTYATILRYIELFWIRPYNATFAGIEIDDSDLTDISNIPDDKARPLNFSIQNQNPLSALDSVVQALPGKWMWYLDYGSAINRVKIRIKEIETSFASGTVSLVVGDNTEDECEPLCDSEANVTSVNIRRNIDKAVKNVIAKGGKIKVVTTIKLVPLWRKYPTGAAGVTTDFENNDDKKQYQTFLLDRISESNNPLLFENNADESKKLEWLRKYRYYGIPIEGNSWADSIVDSVLTGGSVSTDLDLVGDIASHYTALTTNLKDMMFNGVRIDREIAPPQYKRYSDDIVVFMYDADRTGQIKIDDTTVANREARTESGTAINLPYGTTLGSPTLIGPGGATPYGNISVKGRVANNFDAPESNAVNDEEEVGKTLNDNRWVIPSQENIDYKIDEKNGIIIFDAPQVQSSQSTGEGKTKQQEDAVAHITSISNHEDVQSRDVYMTATFTLDVAAILSKRIGAFGGGGISIVDLLDGPNFSEYIIHNDADIVVHNSAFYPLTATEKDQLDPDYSDDEMDNKPLGRKIRPAQSFDDYKLYGSLGALELFTAINSFLEGHTDLEEEIIAALPYLELGYSLGDNLLEIENTNYTDLKSYLTSISYTAVGESDLFNTQMRFSNNYRNSKTNDKVVNKNTSNNADGNKREILEYDNLAQNILI